jgi:hypothetical protein
MISKMDRKYQHSWNRTIILFLLGPLILVFISFLSTIVDVFINYLLLHSHQLMIFKYCNCVIGFLVLYHTIIRGPFMKKLYFLFISFSIVLAVSCSNEITNPSSANSGKLLLKIDKQNAPDNVVFVKAYLTRENHQPISETLNLLSDSTAEILLNEIDAGTWHLKVDAEDDSGLVLYTGETDLQVFAGFTSQVYLTLQPTGSGTGSIYIYVNWGVPVNYAWLDYNTNPIIESSNNYYDYYGTAQPVVLYDEGVYKMWYVGLDYAGNGRGNILYAISNDGLNWIPYAGNPVITPGNYGNWDTQNVQPCAILKENGVYKLYYTGFSDAYGTWSIGLATSVNGINWEKHPNPILQTSSSWDYQLVASAIVKFNNSYYLYYTGRNMPYYSVGVAVSSDGINFIKYPGNPILTSTQQWEANGVVDGNVIIEGGLFKMAYGNSNGSGFGLATSSDGLNWTKANNNPFFTNQSTSNNWAAGKIAYPYWLKLPNELRIYYSGTATYSDEHRIGMMRKSGN